MIKKTICCLMMIALLVACDSESESVNGDRFKTIYDEGTFGISVIKDKETGCQFVIFDDANEGGMAPIHGTCDKGAQDGK